MTPFYPIWKRSPNKFIRYEDRRFTCGDFSGTKTIAIYTDRGGKTQEETAYVVWDDDIKKEQ